MQKNSTDAENKKSKHDKKDFLLFKLLATKQNYILFFLKTPKYYCPITPHANRQSEAKQFYVSNPSRRTFRRNTY